ncbi:alcohol oxidase [Cristinia sonorae]|uniref:Alcohol oxidase n=1 Tax=Cristinia sonorae TaxID=1940300 RepID=A0A8K0UFW1_9AGAR|nr:alcohol oxidase [Cristinia sonorae]
MLAWVTLVLGVYGISIVVQTLASPLDYAHPTPFGVTSDATVVDGQTFDYIVVGGGLAGLTVASRLSEDPSSRVLVIEAGGDNRTNPLIYDILQFTVAFDGPMDWAWRADRNKTIHGGKTLGGGSSINGASWTRGTKAQYDVLTDLLEPSEAHLGWNWDNMLKYMKKAEAFSPPSHMERALGADFIPAYHGFSGPVKSGFFSPLHDGPQQSAFEATVMNLTSITHSRDINGGDPNAVSITPMSIHGTMLGAANRSSSAESYLTPVEKTRHNWITLVDYMATKIVFSNKSTTQHTATGVRFGRTDRTGKELFAFARKEVIVAAGAIQTPALLQLSGIGDPALLKRVGIPTLVDLKTVGRNLQEQTQSTMSAVGNGFNDTLGGLTEVIAFPNIYQLFGARVHDIIRKVRSSLGSWAASQADSALSATALRKLFELQSSIIVDHKAPVFEYFFVNGLADGNLGITMWPLLPFSRGTVTLSSPDPFAKPDVNVNYFGVELDLDVHIEVCRLARRIFQSPPLSALSAGEIVPGFSAVPDSPEGGSTEDWANWILNDPKFNFTSVAHPIGTAAMMRRSLGGVVDGRLKVYGTTNVRVVDASILPYQISAHLSSTLYGVAEKAADLIKQGI